MTILNNLNLTPKTLKDVGLESGSKEQGLAVSSALGLNNAVEIAESINDLNEINFQFSQVDALTRVQGRLESLVSRVENISVDGLTQREALFVSDSINEINEELGADLISMPANESFGDKISAKTYTELGLEEASKGLNKIWEVIIETIKKTKEMLAAWWDKFFGSVEGLKKDAEALKAKADSYDNEKEDKKVKVTGKLLFIDGAKPTNSTIKAGTESITASVDGFLVKQGKTAEAVVDAVEKAMDKADGSEANLKAGFMTLVGNADLAKYCNGSHIGSVTDGVVFGKGVMGGKVVKFENALSIPTAGENTTDRASFYSALGKVSYKVKGPEDKKGADKEVSIDRLSQNDVESIADSVIDAAASILDMRKSRTDARKYADNITKAAEGLKKDAEGLDTDEKVNRTEMSNLSKAAVSCLKELSGGSIAAWTAHVVSVSNAAIKVANASI